VHVAHTIERFAKASTLLAIVLGSVGILMAATGLDHGRIEPWYHALKALSIVLPLVTAALLTYATARDVTRRSTRFREMIRSLEEAKLRVSTARTWPALGRAVTEAEWLLQAELGEWHAFTRYAGELHG